MQVCFLYVPLFLLFMSRSLFSLCAMACLTGDAAAGPRLAGEDDATGDPCSGMALMVLFDPDRVGPSRPGRNGVRCLGVSSVACAEILRSERSRVVSKTP